MLAKFTDFISLDTEAAHDYGQRYMWENYPTYSRLKIGASTAGTQLLMQLSNCLVFPVYCLYVLVIARSATKEGRYQSPAIETPIELTDFLLDYQQLFESDGRHHLWISSPAANATLVYDKHNVIYAYGPLEEFAAELQKVGYREEEFDLPFPHAHNYLVENDSSVESLLQYWNWQYFPLQEIDEE
ncbi:MAG: hypothetical protein ACRYFX_11225 [Janthinobacterium lividum]